MPLFNVYLAELGETGLTDSIRDRIQSKLLTWFTQITSPTEYSPMVNWVSSEPSIQNYELLAYFIPTAAESVVISIPGYALGAGSKVGVTAKGTSERATEIYAQGQNVGLEQLVFHELMHNKLNLFGGDLHKKDGLAVSMVTPGANPSETNISDMRAALSNNQPQWTGGWRAYAEKQSQ